MFLAALNRSLLLATSALGVVGGWGEWEGECGVAPGDGVLRNACGGGGGEGEQNTTGGSCVGSAGGASGVSSSGGGCRLLKRLNEM